MVIKVLPITSYFLETISPVDHCTCVEGIHMSRALRPVSLSTVQRILLSLSSHKRVTMAMNETGISNEG